MKMASRDYEDRDRQSRWGSSSGDQGQDRGQGQGQDRGQGYGGSESRGSMDATCKPRLVASN